MANQATSRSLVSKRDGGLRFTSVKAITISQPRIHRADGTSVYRYRPTSRSAAQAFFSPAMLSAWAMCVPISLRQYRISTCVSARTPA